MTNPKVRAVLLFVLILAFGVLGFGGYLINKEKPPIPQEVVSESGEILFTGENIIAGQEYYLSRGGQHIGSVWGHGSYLAPDWSADYLHRLGLFVAARFNGLDTQQAGSFTQADFENLSPGKRGEVQGTTTDSIKTNRYDPSSQRLVLTPYQAEAFSQLTNYYTDLFRNGNEDMGLQSGIVKTDQQGQDLTAFFAWLAWAAGTNRPDQSHTYTNNWPYDPLVGNTPLPDALIWSIVSVILLILLIAVVLFIYLKFMREDDYQAELRTKMEEPQPTPSQKMTLPYFLIAIILFVGQIGLGSIVAHYTVEGTSFYGIPLGDVMPYALARTWHLQLAIFWIATCFLAAGLFIGPHIGKEPKKQGLLSGILLGAIAIVVLRHHWAVPGFSVTGRMDPIQFPLRTSGI